MATTVYDLSKWHAALRRTEAAIRHEETGEVRVPLALQRLDEHAGDVELVLSRREVEQMHQALGQLLAGYPAAMCAAVR